MPSSWLANFVVMCAQDTFVYIYLSDGCKLGDGKICRSFLQMQYSVLWKLANGKNKLGLKCL